jgi:hypothetical protein
MEAIALYQNLKNNLNIIVELLERGTDIRSTPYTTTIPLEVAYLARL